MDVVYPYKRRNDEFELRYSLRSLVAHVPHDRVIVAGEKPAFSLKSLAVVPTLPCSDRFKSSTANIAAAVQTAGISGDFIAMNDDFFLLRRWKYRPEHRGTIDEYVASGTPAGPYLRAVVRTKEMLKAHGVDEPLFFGMHKPTIYDSGRLLELITEFKRESYLLRTLYGNLFPVPARRRTDVKLYAWPGEPPKGDVVSTSDQCAKDPACRAWLAGLFPQPTIYEKPVHRAQPREAA